jgi:predicted amidohydrolase YtcJ
MLTDTNWLTQHEAKVKHRVKTVDNGWILGWGHSLIKLLEASNELISYLDNISLEKPIAIMESTSHSMWVNSDALAADDLIS